MTEISGTSSTELRNSEPIPLPTIEIPIHLTEHLHEKTEQILELFDSTKRQKHRTPDELTEWYTRPTTRPDLSPNVVIIALRGAGLYTQMVEKAFEKNLQPGQRPLVLEAWIGRYAVTQAEQAGDNSILPPNANFTVESGTREKISQYMLEKSESREMIEAYRAWLRSQPNIRKIADQLTESAMEYVSDPVPLIIDDWQSDNHTFMTAAEVTHIAFGNEWDPYMVALYGYEKTGKGENPLLREDEQIINATFARSKLPNGQALLETKGVMPVLKDLIKGYVVIDGNLIPIDSTENLALYKQQLKKPEDQAKRQALGTLSEVFGEKEILSFRQKVAEKIAEKVVE